MQINLSELLLQEGKVIQVSTKYSPDVFISKLGTFPIIDKKPIQFVFTNKGKKKIGLEAEFDFKMVLPCDRCLEDVYQDFHIEITRELDMKKTEAQRIEALDEADYLSGSNLDVDRLIYSEILLNLPMKVLCSESCKGICNRCGTNLNHGTCDCDTTELDPRMARIRDIFNNS